MGQNIMALSLADPFHWILFLAGEDHIPGAVIWIELIKVIATSMIFFLFLRTAQFSSYTSIIGSLLFSFSGFMLVGGAWSSFSTELFLLALLLFAFERFYQRNLVFLFPVAVAFIAWFNPFNLWLYGVFLILYMFFRFLYGESWHWKKISGRILLLAGLAVLGVCIGSFNFIQYVRMLLESPRAEGDSSLFFSLFSVHPFALERTEHYVTLLYRLFSSDLLGNARTYTGWHNYLEAPLPYIGLLPLLLWPFGFTGISARKKWALSAFILVMILPAVFPFFRYALYLFAGDYYRGYSVFLSLSLLIPALFGIQKIFNGKKIPLYLLLVNTAILLILISLPLPMEIKNLNMDGSSYIFRQAKNDLMIADTGKQNTIRILLVLYACLLLLTRFRKMRVPWLFLVLFLICAEIVWSGRSVLQGRLTMRKTDMRRKAYFHDNSLTAVRYIHSIDSLFYRINKTYRYGPGLPVAYNDSKIQDFYGTLSYHSFNQKYYIRFLHALKLIHRGDEWSTRFSAGVSSNPILWPLLSVKYYIDKQSNPSAEPYGFDSVTGFGNFGIFRAKLSLPLGFSYSSCLQEHEFFSLSQTQRAMTMYRAVVIDSADFRKYCNGLKRFEPEDTLGFYFIDDLSSYIDALKIDTLRILSFSQNRIDGEITLRNAGVLFFSIPYDQGWRAIADGRRKNLMISNIGFMGLYLEPGEHRIELTFAPINFFTGMAVSLAGIVIYLILYFIFRKRWKWISGDEGEPNQQ